MVLYKPIVAKNHQNSALPRGRIATGTGRRGAIERMSDAAADFAVIGSTPLARLLAGLLGGEHGKRVIHIGESQSGYRLPRGIDLSVAPITRPDTWAVLRPAVDETIKLVGRVAGRGAWSYVDPIIFAQGAHAAEALSHVRHMAAAYGVAVEPTLPSMLGHGRVGLTLRDAVRFNRAQLEPALDTWLGKQGVQSLLPDQITVRPDGSARLRADGSEIVVQQAILADDAAVLAHLPAQQWPALVRRQPTSTILTTPTQPLASPVMLEIQTGTLLLQQGEGGIAAIGPNGLAAFSAHMQLLLGRDRQVEQAGQTSFATLTTLDGAPAVGRAAGSGADVLVGLGHIGPFLAPSLARWIAGVPRPDEAAWFGARLVNRNGRSAPVGDYAPGGGHAA